MIPDRLAAAVAALHRARTDLIPMEELPSGCRPADGEAGRTIQEAWTEQAVAGGWDLAGFKIGCTSVHAQEMLATDSPFPGRVFAPFVYTSPAAVPAGTFIAPMVEGEFAFRLGSDLPPRAAPYSREEVTDAVAALHPAIELIDTRFTRFAEAGVNNLIADSGANGGLVLGPAVADWQAHDLAAATVVMTVDGEEKARGTGAEVLGHPLAALTWLANDLARRGHGMAAGQVVTTGTCTAVFPLPPGATAVADHGPLGAVTVTHGTGDTGDG